MSDPAISCLDVRKRYGAVIALDGVSLEVQPGSVFGFLGPNGAGKSTLVKILTGLVPRAQGTVRVLGGRPGERAVQRRTGYLPELFRFPTWLTGTELLRFHGRLAGVPVDPTGLLDLVGIGQAGERRVGTYSKGMQQRLGLAQALVGDPELVFLDEPTSALDPLGRLDVRDVLVRLRERGMTVFLNSHLLTEVEKVCDQVAVIDQGTIVAQGTMDELLQKPNARIRVGDLTPPQAQAASARLGVPAAAYARGVLTVPVARPEDVPTLVKTVVDLALPVYEVTLERRTLEDAFVHVVRTHQDATAIASPPEEARP
ncbi:MAG: ABC transporter ATP-binding protein [Thermoleophilia bacterium]|nr:ABC transporter ATP-binding protein [Thermoleophilia bacterium]